MRRHRIYSIAICIAAASFTSTVIQAGPGSAPVTVINDAARPVPVTVENPLTTITIDNADTNPVPVTVENPVTTMTIDNADSNPVPVTIADPVSITTGTKYRFAGFTAFGENTLPNIGLAAMNDKCREPYGDDARMCSTDEYFLTPTAFAATPRVATGWLRPVMAGTVYDSTSQTVTHVEWSGIVFPDWHNDATCQQWTTNDSARRATVLLTHNPAVLKVDTFPCDRTLPVVCCTPQ